MYSQVVNFHVKQRHFFECAIRVLEVKLGSPVVGFIGLGQRGSAGRGLESGVAHSQIEVASAHNGMHMAGRDARTDDGVRSAGEKWPITIEVIDSKGARSLRRLGRRDGDAERQ